jgi:hypothetical protein
VTDVRFLTRGPWHSSFDGQSWLSLDTRHVSAQLNEGTGRHASNHYGDCFAATTGALQNTETLRVRKMQDSFPKRLPVSEPAKKVRKYRKVPEVEVQEVKSAKSSQKNSNKEQQTAV